jgi:hypothetical protein
MIPTVFRRDVSGYCLPEPTPGCEWVLAGEGKAQRKYDGVAVRFEGQWQVWWRPRAFYGSGRRLPGLWARPQDTPYGDALTQALGGSRFPRQGSYELCGPGIHCNSEGFDQATLVWHRGIAPILVPRDRDGLAQWFAGQFGRIYGLVFTHPDGMMAKIRGHDLRTGMLV